MKIGIQICEIATVVGVGLTVYLVIIRPWRRQGRLSFDGMLCIAFFTLWALQDPILNYTQIFFTYNAHFVNFGCPQCFLPGWQSNAETFGEPVIFAAGWYVAVLTSAVFIVNRIMRRAKRKWPRLGIPGMFTFTFMVCLAVDLVAEIPMMIIPGWYVYGGAGDYSLFHGKYFQFPYYEAVLGSLFFVGFCMIRFYRNDRGECVAEWGIERIRTSPRRTTLLRLLAIIGVANASFFVTYNLPAYWFAIHGDDWPEDILERSYFTTSVCGIDSEYACPGPRVPIPRGPDSAHATPQGKLIAPAGLPVQVGSNR
jgi:hypothetical protein